MKKSLGLLFIMLTLASCNVQQDTSVNAANTPGNGVSGPGGSDPTTDTRIFDQGFELRDDLYISFNECTYGEYCEILINYNPDPVFITVPGFLPFEDTSIQMMCVGDVIVEENGMLTISDSSGNKAECADFDGDYLYTVGGCSLLTFSQKNWFCGTAGYPNALQLLQI